MRLSSVVSVATEDYTIPDQAGLLWSALKVSKLHTRNCFYEVWTWWCHDQCAGANATVYSSVVRMSLLPSHTRRRCMYCISTRGTVYHVASYLACQYKLLLLTQVHAIMGPHTTNVHYRSREELTRELPIVQFYMSLQNDYIIQRQDDVHCSYK